MTQTHIKLPAPFITLPQYLPATTLALCVTRPHPVTRSHPLTRSHQIIRSNQTINSLFWLYQNECQRFDTKFDMKPEDTQKLSFDMF